MDLVEELHRIAAALAKNDIRYAVCGGLAVTIHGAPRTTRDIDLVVDGSQIEEVLEAVRPLGYRFAAAPMVFDRATAKERRVQRVTRVEGEHSLTLDLLAAGGFLGPVLEGRQRIDLPQGPLWVVSREGLATMKRVAARPQDLRDLELLGIGDG